MPDESADLARRYGHVHPTLRRGTNKLDHHLLGVISSAVLLPKINEDANLLLGSAVAVERRIEPWATRSSRRFCISRSALFVDIVTMLSIVLLKAFDCSVRSGDLGIAHLPDYIRRVYYVDEL